jgi:hypothetical protein
MSEAIFSIIFGFVGVIVGSVIPWIKESLSDRSQRSRHANYLAVQIVCVLDEFIDTCFDVVCDDGTYMGQPAGAGPGNEDQYIAQVALPVKIDYPTDLEWKSIHSDLMYRILILPNSLRTANRVIDWAAENSFMPENEDYFEARHEQYSNLGLEALALTETIRKTYKLPDVVSNGGSPRQQFESAKLKIQLSRDKSARLIEDMNASLDLTLKA